MSGPQRPPPPPYQPQMQKQQQHTEFTPEMRDRQARGKDPYSVHEDASRPGGSRGAESFEVVQKRRVAAQMLDTPELLMMDAQRVDDSIPATRLRYTRMLCGMDQPPQHGSSSSAAQSSSRQAHGSSSKSRTHTPSKRQNSGGK
ncbi:hypothetical protein PFICI_09431 [Pestalotiopsis fici W106-1]|uniref:Uncharacterized protein n=1 Tax=Pestalotiopsis fici (strain W106-1 / CGMCC3.15140) TaxID=1229662 RepID=W3X0B3_PESFW|nr:uncharacterized protein PFICI_09431 [Pestalotiopsis fici W106-1]ETS79578.1 hypothetical protein PFICI_09431 [Pestalotiopsis fici W106-1]